MSNISIIFVFAFMAVLVVGLSNPDHGVNRKPGYCNHYDIYIKEGETAPGPVGFCVELWCRNAEYNSVPVKKCKLELPDREGCKIELGDPAKQYPYCCTRVICNDSVDVSNKN